jgi:hypothetical protein
MTFALRILALSVVLGLVQIVLASHAASLQRGYHWTASSRDEAVPRLTEMAGRLARALRASNSTLGLLLPTSPCMQRVYFSCAQLCGTQQTPRIALVFLSLVRTMRLPSYMLTVKHQG